MGESFLEDIAKLEDTLTALTSEQTNCLSGRA